MALSYGGLLLKLDCRKWRYNRNNFPIRLRNFYFKRHSKRFRIHSLAPMGDSFPNETDSGNKDSRQARTFRSSKKKPPRKEWFLIYSDSDYSLIKRWVAVAVPSVISIKYAPAFNEPTYTLLFSILPLPNSCPIMLKIR